MPPPDPAQSGSTAGGGPVVVLACAIGAGLGIGPIYLINFSLFMGPLSAELGWSRLGLSVGLAACTLMAAFSFPALGRLADAFGPKPLIVTSTLLFALSLAGMSALSDSYLVFLLLSAVLGLVSGGTSPLLYMTILPGWFDRRLGIALGLAVSGAGVSGMISPIACSALISQFGWRATYSTLALVIMLVALPNALFLLRSKPEPGTDIQMDRRSGTDGGLAASRREALHSPVFWRTSIAVFLMGAVTSGFVVHLIPMLTDRGLSSVEAAPYLSVFGLAVLAGRVATGIALDRLPSGLVGLASFTAPAAGTVLMAVGVNGGFTVVPTFLVGLAFGAEVDILAYIIKSHFGLKSYASILGLAFAALSLGVLVGPVLMGSAFDILGSYTPMLMAFTVMAVLAAWLISRAGRTTGSAS